MKRGLLLTMTEPPPHREEEFNAWYDDEHMAERLAIPGFRSARRWVADLPPGEGKYLATYELDSAAVLTSPAYLARLNNPTPWSKRSLEACVLFRRWACEQVAPGTAAPHAQAGALWLVLGDDAAALQVPKALQVRHFRDPQGKPQYATLYELSRPAPAPAGFRLYAAYSP
jgi:hypothetical protein